MSRKVFNMQGGSHSAAALSAFLNAMYGSSVANGLEVTPTGSAGLAVTVTAGTGNINTGQGFGRMIQLDPSENVTLTAASAANPRNDLIVAYIDMAVTPTTGVIDNINDIFKLKAVAGSPATTPADPSNSTIQSAIGAGNPFMKLARVRVNTSATSLTQGNITDLRVLVSPPLSTSMIGDFQVTTPKIANASVTAAKIDFATLTLGYAQITSNFVANSVSGDVVVTGLSTTVTIPSGGANIKITFWASSMSGSNTGYYYRQAIKEGGTTLSYQQFKNAVGEANLVTMYRGFATAGTHTYSAAVSVGASANITVQASSTSPAFILVEMA